MSKLTAEQHLIVDAIENEEFDFLNADCNGQNGVDIELMTLQSSNTGWSEETTFIYDTQNPSVKVSLSETREELNKRGMEIYVSHEGIDILTMQQDRIEGDSKLYRKQCGLDD